MTRVAHHMGDLRALFAEIPTADELTGLVNLRRRAGIPFSAEEAQMAMERLRELQGMRK